MGDQSLGVSEAVCKERVQRIEDKIASSSQAITNSLDTLNTQVTTLVERHEEAIQEVTGKVEAISDQMIGVVQWKANGERQKDAWYKRQTLRTAILLLIAGIITNPDKINMALRSFLAILSGGKP